MKQIGIIGGVSPESTVIYYRLLNGLVQQRLGGEHSANVIVQSLDYGMMLQLYREDNWTDFKSHVVQAGKNLTAAGCEILAISSNTTQVGVYDLMAQVDTPVVLMHDALVAEMNMRGIKQPLLLGTAFTMEGFFYRSTLREKYEIETIVPDTDDRVSINRIIFEELCQGKVLETSRAEYIRIINCSLQSGCDGVILGCTEIGMLIEQKHIDAPVLDSTLIHTNAIAKAAFESTRH